jgi:hypothetical protein
VQAICGSRFVAYQNLVGFGNYFMPPGLPHMFPFCGNSTGESSLGGGSAARFRNAFFCFRAKRARIAWSRCAAC